jgi:RNA polymerase sigma-70 factor (ECF subfamily)
MTSRCQQLLDALDGRSRATLERDDDLGAWLDAAIEGARMAWPALAVPEHVFLAYLAAKIGALRVPGDYRTLHTADLALACACVQRCPRAIESFTDRYRASMKRAMARGGVTGPEADELWGVLGEKLFFGREPRLAKYSGRGALAGWTRAVARNAAVNQNGAAHRHVDLDEVLETPDAQVDPETRYLSSVYSAEFRTSLLRAIQSLSSRDRALLRQHHVDGWTVDALGKHYGVHRATAADWLVRARGVVARDVRRDLTERLSLCSRELDSVLRIACTAGPGNIAGML